MQFLREIFLALYLCTSSSPLFAVSPVKLDSALFPAPRGNQFKLSRYETKPDRWYASEEAREIAHNLISWQLPHGGWSKNIDMAARPKMAAEAAYYTWNGSGTFDNNTTTSQIRFLYKVYEQTSLPELRASILKGLDFTFASQYASGGWPQAFPLIGGYLDFVAINDHNMTRALTLLADISSWGKLLPQEYRLKSAKAFNKGIKFLLQAQQKQNGHFTGWCQQHHPTKFTCQPGRAFEPIALSLPESRGAFELLKKHGWISKNRESDFLNWVEISAIKGIAWNKRKNRGMPVKKKGAVIWSRYYDLNTNAPLFCGYDGKIRNSIAEIGDERRTHYSWYGDWGLGVLALR